MKSYYVYILASHKQGTLYVGVTNNLERRTLEHKANAMRGFTSRYGVKQLVYFEETDSIEAAIAREKQFKNWKRAWKIELIEQDNPEWKDLAADMAVDSGSSPE